MKQLLLFLLVTLCIPVHSTTVNKTLQVGETFVVSSIRPGTGYSFANSYESSNESVVSVLVENTGAYSETIGQTQYGPITAHYTTYRFNFTGLKAGMSTINLGYKNSSGNFTIYNTYIINVVEVKNIVIPSILSLTLGESYQFTPIITDAEAIANLTWNSSNTNVANIDADGKVTTSGIGTSTITCTAQNGVSAQCEVTVNPVLVSGITLNQTEVEMVVGEKMNLTATITPNNATDKSITWSSTNESIAVVDEDGQVTAIASGYCQIKAISNDGSGKTAVCNITVEKDNKLTLANMSICKGGRSSMHVMLTNEELVSGFQFELTVPNSVTVAADDNGNLLAGLTDRASNYTVSANKVTDGLYRFVVISMAGKTISQGTGEVMTIALDAANNITEGEYDLTIKEIGLTVKRNSEFVEVYPRDSNAKLTVTNVMPGDVNGDGKTSVTDVISIISYVLGNEPTQFLFPAADITGDGKVSVTDAVSVIDIILNDK